MTDSARPSDPTRSPIINSPYDTPAWHWSLDKEFRACEPPLPGRRPSGAYLSVPKPQKRQASLDLTGGHRSSQQIEPHKQINAIRAAVDAWRDAGHPGARAATMALIEHWSNPDTDGLQPYFCQRDAVETAIFLTDGPEAARTPFNDRLENLNAKHNEAIPRIALKLATGTGKTLVMAMLMLWQAQVGYSQDFVIFVPNLTIRDRLKEIQNGSPLYDRLRPKGDRTRFRVTIINFQAWQPRAGIGIEGTMTKEQMRHMGLDAERYRHATTELAPDTKADTLVLVAEPDIEVQEAGDGEWTLEVKGFDSYNPATGQVTPHEGIKEIECLMIDTNYDGAAFFARAIHFPGQSEDRRLKRLKDRLGARLDPDHWETCLGAKSRPFVAPESGEVAVRITTRAGAELTTVRHVPAA